MKKLFLYLLVIAGLALGSPAIWGCNNGGGEEDTGDDDTCDNAVAAMRSGSAIVLQVYGTTSADGLYEIRRLPDTTTRPVDARANMSVFCP